MTRTVYWNDDSQRHTQDDEFRVEDHLEKKYGYPVNVQVDLESDDIDNPDPASNFNRAHGYIRDNWNGTGEGTRTPDRRDVNALY